MTPADALAHLGGIASRMELGEVIARRDLAAALADGSLMAVGRSHVRLGSASHERALARSHNGVLAGESAALQHGWKVKQAPRRPVVLVARNNARRTTQVEIVRRDVPGSWVKNDALNPVATVIDCALRLPADAALAVADSALRAGVSKRVILDAVPRLAGRHHARVCRLVAAADGLAANPFESVARSISHQVAGLALVPQVSIGGHGHADLADADLRIAVECQSWSWHGDQDAFRKDVRRLTRMTTSGWIVLQFVWVDVMRRPAWVRARLEEAVAMAQHARLHTFSPAS